jgi:hypothetical protein
MRFPSRLFGLACLSACAVFTTSSVAQNYAPPVVSPPSFSPPVNNPPPVTPPTPQYNQPVYQTPTYYPQTYYPSQYYPQNYYNGNCRRGWLDPVRLWSRHTPIEIARRLPHVRVGRAPGCVSMMI